MRRLPWSEFVRAYPRAHLVAACLPETEEIGTRHAREKRNVLVSAIRQLTPSAIYATTVFRAGGKAEIHCAFVAEADATFFATVMNAKPVAQYPGYATQHLFCFDDAAASALRRALPPSSSGERQGKQVREVPVQETTEDHQKRG